MGKGEGKSTRHEEPTEADNARTLVINQMRSVISLRFPLTKRKLPDIMEQSAKAGNVFEIKNAFRKRKRERGA